MILNHEEFCYNTESNVALFGEIRQICLLIRLENESFQKKSNFFLSFHHRGSQ